jgi:hypothetical protein
MLMHLAARNLGIEAEVLETLLTKTAVRGEWADLDVVRCSRFGTTTTMNGWRWRLFLPYNCSHYWMFLTLMR